MLYWLSVGIIDLLLLTYQDLFKKKLVDDRLNFFMLGSTYSLLSWYKHKWYFVMALILISGILFIYVKKFGLVGEADSKTIVWSFAGFAIINLGWLAFYVAAFVVIMLLYLGVARYIFKHKGIVAGYPVFFIAFLLTCLRIWGVF